VTDGSLIPRLRRARRDPTKAVLEGLHAVKHALRFGARVELLVTRDAQALHRLAGALAPDVAEQIERLALEVSPATFAELTPLPVATGVVGLAERPVVDPEMVLGSGEELPLVLLEDPRDLGNMGACVRVAAAAAAGGVLSTGSHDPWQPDALRGAAGLHFALPVARLASLTALDLTDRPLIALDPDGEPLDPALLAARSVLAFGSERRGLSAELAGRAQQRVRIPMRPGVSSLNLATSVAAVLFAWRLAG